VTKEMQLPDAGFPVMLKRLGEKNEKKYYKVKDQVLKLTKNSCVWSNS
jgi:hypothetical protein